MDSSALFVIGGLKNIKTGSILSVVVERDGTTKDVFSHNVELKEAHLEPPHVTQLCQKLGVKKTF